MTPRKTTRARAKPKKAAPKKTPAAPAPATRRPTVRKHRGPPAAPAPDPATTAVPVKQDASHAPKGFIVVDGSNIANSSRTDGKPSLHNIQRVHDVLVHEGYEPIIFVDASLRHQIDESEKKLFEKWEGNAFIVQVPRGVNGDEAVLEFATRRNAPVLSNDNYQDLESRFPWVRDRTRRIPYNLVRGELILYAYPEMSPRPAASTQAPPGAAPRSGERGRQRRPGRQSQPPSPSAPASAPSSLRATTPPAPARTPLRAPVPEPAAPTQPATSNPSPTAPAEKHPNFRRARPPPVQPLVPQPIERRRIEPEPDLDVDPLDTHVIRPQGPPPERRRGGGRGQHVPRATDEEKRALKETLVKIFDEKVQPGGSIRADQLSEETRRSIPGFRPNYYGSSSFTKLLDRMDDVFELARRGPNGQMASLEGPPGWPIVVLRRNGPV